MRISVAELSTLYYCSAPKEAEDVDVQCKRKKREIKCVFVACGKVPSRCYLGNIDKPRKI
jgi:hypothetical protein